MIYFHASTWPEWTDRVAYTTADPDDLDRDDDEAEEGEPFEVEGYPDDDHAGEDPTEGEAGPYGDDVPY